MTSELDSYSTVVEAADRFGGKRPPGPPLQPPGGDDGMEVRLKRLEDDVRELKADVKGIGTDVNYIKGRVDSMPTTIQLLGFVIAIFVAAGIMRFFGH